MNDDERVARAEAAVREAFRPGSARTSPSPGPVDGAGAPPAGDQGRLPVTEVEAVDVLVADAFGRPVTREQLAAAQSFTSDAMTGAGVPASMRRGEASSARSGSSASVLESVLAGGAVAGFDDSHERRMRDALGRLRSLAESRLGMTARSADDHARRLFLEMQHEAAQANETKERFVGRLEHRVGVYSAMSPLASTGVRS